MNAVPPGHIRISASIDGREITEISVHEKYVAQKRDDVVDRAMSILRESMYRLYLENGAVREAFDNAPKKALSFSEYQQGTTHTRIYRDKIAQILTELGISDQDKDGVSTFASKRLATLLGIAYAGLGMGEVGEVQGKVKKVIRDSGGVITDDVRTTIAGELGDCLWYLAAMSEELGLDLGQIAQSNLDKLADRKARGVIQGSGDKR